nr:MAG TPA: hypothetical protein [Caudoviricetes sp.]
MLIVTSRIFGVQCGLTPHKGQSSLPLWQSLP